MALRVWLPLNGSVENKGIGDITFTNQATSGFSDNGKIGKCLNTLNSYYYFTVPQLVNATTFSCCFWYKQNGSSSLTTNWRRILDFTTQRSGESNGLLRFESSYGIANYAISVHSNASYQVCPSTVGNRSLAQQPDTWYHIAMTLDGSMITFYVNGEVFNSGAQTTGSLTGAVSICETGSQADGWLNDVRIYDHCLSAKEVKEISQGLVLHYKLDGSNQVFNGVRNYLGNSRPYYTGYDFNDTNKLLRRNYNRNSSSGNPPFDQTYDAVSDIVYENDDQFRRIIISSDRDNTTTNNYQIMHPWIYDGYEKYTNDGSFWSSIQVGDKISFSCYVRSNNYFLLKSVLRIFTSSSNYAYHFFTDGITYGVDVGNLNEWYKLSSTLTVTQELYDLISNWDGMTRFMLIMQFSQAPNVSIASENIVIDFKEYMLEFSDTPHDWMPAPEDFNIDETKVTDSSGYGNDGVITGTLSTESDSNRYEISTHYQGSSYTDTGSGTFNWFDFSQCTLSAWIKPTASVSGWSGSIGVQHNQSAGHKGFSITDYANNFRVVTVNGSYTTINSGKPLTVGEWHHCAAVLDGTNLKMYYDGSMVKESTVSWGSAAIATDMRFATGVDFPGSDEMFTGNYSDVRMYCTALSAEDILDLYHTSANIDNENKLHTFELEETSENILSSSAFEQGGIVDANGTETEITTRLRTFYVPVMPNTSYKIFTNDNFQVRGVHFFTENKTWISWISFFAQTGQFTTPSNCYYIRIPFQKADSGANITLADLDSMVPTLTAIIERTNGLSNKAYNVNIFKNGITRANNFSISPKSSIDKSGIIEAADFIEK